MDQKNYDPYRDLGSYAKELHEKNRKRVRNSGILLILLPLILGLIRWMTDSDKMVFMIIWVLCMFALSAYLVSVEYMDHMISKAIGKAKKGEDE